MGFVGNLVFFPLVKDLSTKVITWWS